MTSGSAAGAVPSSDSTSDDSTSNTGHSTADQRAPADLPEPGDEPDTDGDLVAHADPAVGQQPRTSRTATESHGAERESRS